MSNLPVDMKDYRSKKDWSQLVAIIAITFIMCLFALLARLGELDHQAKLEQIKIVKNLQCT